MTHRLDDGGVRRRGARDGGDDARRGGRHHNLYARENTRARARVVSHAFAFAFAFARPRARPAPAESSSRRVVTHRVLSIHIRHPMPSDPWMHRARARPMLPSSIARSRARISSNVLLARRLVSSSSSSSRDRRPRTSTASSREPSRPAGRTNERTTKDDDDDRTIDRTRATRRTLFFSAHPPRARRVTRVAARALAASIHPSTRARSVRPWRGSNRIEIGRTFCSLVVSAARATTTRPVRRLEFAVALTARVSRACVIARVVANIVGVCRPRARDGQRRARDGRDRDFD